MGKISNIEGVAEALDNLGYESRVEGDAVCTVVGGTENPFKAVLTMNTDNSKLIVTCQLATVGDIPNEKSEVFAWACLDANTRTRPYALATLTSSDDPSLDADNEEAYPIVLTNSVPLGDLSETELGSAMDSLWEALSAASLVLEFTLSPSAA